jgi:hypothetical protein
MCRAFRLTLVVGASLFAVALSSPATAQIQCTDCIYDADDDGANEEDDDLIDICLDETDPTWSATCEAYDFNDNGAVDIADVSTWDSECGSAPILCEDVPDSTTASLPVISATGRVLTALALMLVVCATFYSTHRRRTT